MQDHNDSNSDDCRALYYNASGARDPTAAMAIKNADKRPRKWTLVWNAEKGTQLTQGYWNDRNKNSNHSPLTSL